MCSVKVNSSRKVNSNANCTTEKVINILMSNSNFLFALLLFTVASEGYGKVLFLVVCVHLRCPQGVPIPLCFVVEYKICLCFVNCVKEPSCHVCKFSSVHLHQKISIMDTVSDKVGSRCMNEALRPIHMVLQRLALRQNVFRVKKLIISMQHIHRWTNCSCPHGVQCNLQHSNCSCSRCRTMWRAQAGNTVRYNLRNSSNKLILRRQQQRYLSFLDNYFQKQKRPNEFYLLVAMNLTPVLSWTFVGSDDRLLPQMHIKSGIQRSWILSISVQILRCPDGARKESPPFDTKYWQAITSTYFMRSTFYISSIRSKMSRSYCEMFEKPPKIRLVSTHPILCLSFLF